MIIFKYQMVLSEITDIDSLEVDYELKSADNYTIFASASIYEPYLY
jgi:hypothetical protein